MWFLMKPTCLALVIAGCTCYLVGLQMLLGIVALGVAMMYQDRSEAPTIRLAIGATHQTVGALVLGGVALALAWINRSLVDDGTAAKNKAAAGSTDAA